MSGNNTFFFCKIIHCIFLRCDTIVTKLFFGVFEARSLGSLSVYWYYVKPMVIEQYFGYKRGYIKWFCGESSSAHFW